MRRLLIFSDKIPAISYQMRFSCKKAARWLSILFKRKKSLETYKLNYYAYWHFENAYLLIEFQFKNAIWFQAGPIKSTDLKTPIVLNLENIPHNKITFTIWGFHQKRTYGIDLIREKRIAKKSFHTKFHNLNPEFVPTLLQYSAHWPDFRIISPKLYTSNVVTKQTNIQFTPTPFKLQYYI